MVLLIEFIIVITVSGGLFYMFLYNGLVTLKQKVEEALAGIDVQLKRRYDLIPNLVKIVQGYAAHEKDTLEKVIAARTGAMNVPTGELAKQAGAENVLTGALKSIFALSENYPELKANQNFLELQKEVSETENQLSSSRRIYNSNVSAFNIKIDTFPSNMVAAKHNMLKAEFFEIAEEQREEMEKSPDISF
jgi:LemA protein